MSLDTHRKEELVNATKELLDALFGISVDAFNKIQTLVEPGFSGFGTGRDEVIQNRDEYMVFFNLMSEQLPGVNYEILRITPKLNDTTGIVEGELNILLKIGQDVVEVYGRFTFVFAQKEERWNALSLHTSVPMAEQVPGEVFPFDALEAKNEELKQLVAKRTALLQQKTEDLEEAILTLKATQAQLIQSEKMASLGELTAGIAHEIQNPLNFVNNFSAVNQELLQEIKQELDKGNYSEIKVIVSDIEANEEKISHHGKRADSIVKGMLQHARSSTGEKEPTDINQLTDEYLRLSYQGLRAKDKAFEAHIQTHFDQSIGNIQAVPQDIGRVLLNLLNNAFYSVNEKKKQLNGTFEPTVTVSTKKEGEHIIITVKDNGVGMSPKVAKKAFQPFFTTKPTGEGTGLGLSLSYDIITKGHGGEMRVESKESQGSEFIITIPKT